MVAWLGLANVLVAQNIPVGTWRTHYSFNTTLAVTQSNSRVYAASAAGVFSVDKDGLSITSLTKLTGLSDTDISSIHINPSSQALIIVYRSGQIDVIKDNQITGISDVRLSDIIDNKTMYGMFDEGVYTYLCGEFGLLKIDTEAGIIRESFLNLSQTGANLPVYAGVLFNDSLFVASEQGVMAGSLQANLKDYNQWKRFDNTDGINSEKTKVIALFNGRPITGNTTQGLVLYKPNGKWNAVNKLQGADFAQITTNGSTLIVANDSLYAYTNAGVEPVIDAALTTVRDAQADGDEFWIADGKNGLVQLKASGPVTLYPNGPFFSKIVKLMYVDGRIFALPPFQSGVGAPALNTSGFSVFEEGMWTNYNAFGYPNTTPIPAFLDISGVSRWTDKLVFSSYGYGLMVWNSEGDFTILDETNSPLVNSNPPERQVLIAGIDTDNTNLWVLNNATDSSLFAYGADQTWYSMFPSAKVKNANSITTTVWGDQWLTIPPVWGGGVAVYASTGSEVYLTAKGPGTLPSNSINQVLLDKEEKMWIATTKGVVYYPFPAGILDDPSQEAIVPIIDSNLLFNNEPVNCLAVDGGNRIWMGTNKGAWLFANDGSELVTHFTTENSPLLSDVVLAIAVNDPTGEVFFNTNKGLISYRGTGTITGTYEQPKIFPNPVPPSYTGVVTIEGVPTNSLVKITDASGRLVAQLQANGNSAVWNLQNSFSEAITTGVYFVFISTNDGATTRFGKIAVVK